LNGKRKITIIGAGLVGSLLSLLLSKRGHRVRVFEKRGDMRRQKMSAGRSINLALAERGIHALRQAGLMDRIKPLMIPMRGRMLHEPDGSIEFSPYGQREHEVIYSVSRGELNKELMTAAEAAGVEIFFDRDCVSIDLSTKTINWTNGHSGDSGNENYDLVIGADGAGSELREAITRATGGEAKSEMLDHDYKELSIPAAADGTHQIEREALHIWPRGGFMLIALPNIDGSFTVTLFLPETGASGFSSLDSQERVTGFFQQQFPDALPLLPELTEDFFANPTGELGTVRCYPWSYEDSALILGDAAHAIVPFHGQGMNAGFEDCSVLIDLLNTYDHDWSRVLDVFEQYRKPDAEAIADMALENYVVMRDSVSDPKFQLKKALGFEMERRYPKRFVPRYSMVMFHRVPYSVAQQRGRVQDTILSEAITGCNSMDDVNVDGAAEQVVARLEELEMD
jgi:kynurenine 3-monooxygenase